VTTKRKKSLEENDVQVAEKIVKKDANRSRANGLIRQTETTLMKAAQRGHISPAEYHEQVLMMKQFETKGIDNSLSVTESMRNNDFFTALFISQHWKCGLQFLFLTDVNPHLFRHCNSTPCVERVWLSNPPMDHFSSNVGDFGWACGYR
jgi:hypothetical protein